MDEIGVEMFDCIAGRIFSKHLISFIWQNSLKKGAEITGYLAVVGIYHMTTMSMILLLAIQTLLHNILPYFLLFAVTAYIFITNHRLNMV